MFDHYDARGLPLACDAAEAQMRSLRTYVDELIVERDRMRHELTEAYKGLHDTAHQDAQGNPATCGEVERAMAVMRGLLHLAAEEREAVAAVLSPLVATPDPDPARLAQQVAERVARAEQATADALSAERLRIAQWLSYTARPDGDLSDCAVVLGWCAGQILQNRHGEAQAADVPAAPHRYLSTACQHSLHDRCGEGMRARGEDGRPHCKFCDAVCECPCHEADVPAAAGEVTHNVIVTACETCGETSHWCTCNAVDRGAA